MKTFQIWFISPVNKRLFRGWQKFLHSSRLVSNKTLGNFSKFFSIFNKFINILTISKFKFIINLIGKHFEFFSYYSCIVFSTSSMMMMSFCCHNEWPFYIVWIWFFNIKKTLLIFDAYFSIISYLLKLFIRFLRNCVFRSSCLINCSFLNLIFIDFTICIYSIISFFFISFLNLLKFLCDFTTCLVHNYHWRSCLLGIVVWCSISTTVIFGLFDWMIRSNWFLSLFL